MYAHTPTGDLNDSREILMPVLSGVRFHGPGNENACAFPPRREAFPRFARTAFVLLLLAVFPMVLQNVQAQQRRADFVQSITSLPEGRQFHSAAVAGGYLYVFSGSTLSEKVTASSLCAPIHSDGSIGAWQSARPLPGPRLYAAASTVVLKDTIYILCGSPHILDARNLNTAIWARALPGGQLTPWSESPALPTPGVACPAAVATSGYIYLIGGLENDKASASVWRIAVLPGGDLGAWEAAQPLPVPLWFHNAALAGGRVYVWGGLQDNAKERIASDRVFSAPALSSGLLGEWREEAQRLPEGFFSASPAVAGPYLFSFSPRPSGGQRVTSDIWWTYAQPDGLAPWNKMETDLPLKVYHASATNYRDGVVYLIGGRVSKQTQVALANAYLMRLAPQAVQMASAQWTGGGATESAQIPTLAPNLAQPAAPGGGAQAPGGGPAGAATFSIEGFLPLETARAKATMQSLPLVLYFTHATCEPALRQNERLRDPQFLALAERQAAFTWIEVDKFPQIAQQFGVFRLPTWIVFNPQGAEIRRHTGLLEPAEIPARLFMGQ